MLFGAGKRPNRLEVRDFASSYRSVSVSHDPAEGSPLQLVSDHGEMVVSAFDGHPARTSESTWIELLHNGLTFDLKGLEPGQADEIPAIEHRFDLASERSAEDFETLRIVPGEHLISGKASMPIVKGMIGLARDMINHFEDLEGVYWPPSQSVIGRRFFESISTAWLEGGAFPALGLTAFKEAEDGALQSVGLDFWVGQELSIEPPLANDKVSATRLAVRIINQVILVGGISEAERITSPDRAVLIMKPSRNQKFIRVCPE